MSLNIHKTIHTKLNYFIEIAKIPNIIFHGPNGSGKRTIVHSFLNKIYNNHQTINSLSNANRYGSAIDTPQRQK